MEHGQQGFLQTHGMAKAIAKSIHDPCPKGWRVPVALNTASLDVTNGTINQYSTIRDTDNPSASIWAMWSATPGASNIRGIGLYTVYKKGTVFQTNPRKEIGAGYGLPVRCVEDGSIDHD